MMNITGRMELSLWSGFEVCGGNRDPGNDPGFDDPALRIAECYTTRTETAADARILAKVVNLVEDDDEEGVNEEKKFQTIIQDVTHDRLPNWKLVSFRVFPDGVRLRYANDEFDFQLAEISGRCFVMNIVVPTTNDPNGPAEVFSINISQSFSGDYYATVRRSGDKGVKYGLWYDNTLKVLTPRPTNKFAKFIAKMLFPDFYQREPTCINYQYGAFSRMYLEVSRTSPILPKEK